MELLERASILMELTDALRARGSWTGETHIQKASYFLQSLLHVPLEFEFILYKYGPYSFGLTGELAGMQANGFLALQPQPFPYGPTYLPGPASRLLRSSYGRVAAQYRPQIQFIAERLAAKPVAELERLATALYVSLQGHPRGRWAARINELKPHVSILDAEHAVAEVDQMRQQASDLGLLTTTAAN
jgi:hypothetical protein